MHCTRYALQTVMEGICRQYELAARHEGALVLLRHTGLDL